MESRFVSQGEDLIIKEPEFNVEEKREQILANVRRRVVKKWGTDIQIEPTRDHNGHRGNSLRMFNVKTGEMGGISIRPMNVEKESSRIVSILNKFIEKGGN